MIAAVWAIAFGTFALAAPSPSPSASAATGAQAPPDGTYVYAIRQNGVAVGTSTIAVKRTDDGLRVHEIETVTVTGASDTADTNLDPVTLAPASFDVSFEVGGKPFKVHLAFQDDGAVESIEGRQTTTLVRYAPGTAGKLVLHRALASGFLFLPAHLHATRATSLTALVPAIADIMILQVDPNAKPARPSTVPPDDAVVAVVGSLGFNEWFDPVSLVVHEIDIPSQKATYVLSKQTADVALDATPQPPPTPLPTAAPHFASKEVTFRSSDGIVLTGTLTVPDGLRRPAPAIILIHGSGKTDRDERVFANPIFLRLSNALSNNGYVVLRYDKRGVGESGGDYRNHTRDQLVSDVWAAVNFLAGRGEVEPKRIFLLGHSEGAELAPSVAANGVKVRGIVLAAAPALPLDKIIEEQATLGLSGQAAEDALRKARQEHAEIKAGKSGYLFPWLRSSFAVDPAKVIARVPCPILIVQGGKDQQVLAKDLPRLVDAAKAAHRDVTVRLFPNDDHLFIPLAGKPDSTFPEYREAHRIDPAVIDAILKWLARY